MNIPPRSSAVALIPARAGSKRLPDKNVRHLGGHPLLAYAISSARRSGLFDTVIVSTESPRYAAVARHYGAEVPFLRPEELAGDNAPDIDWVRYTLERLAESGRTFDIFSILRPTSPFRSAQTIQRAWRQFTSDASADSLRAVEPCAQHPGKMWRIFGDRLVPVLPVQPAGTPWHSSPTQALPAVWVQNASLEIAWTRCALEHGSISGEAIVPFVTVHHEGVDLNDEFDWQYVLGLLDRGEARLPVVDDEPWSEEVGPEPGDQNG